MSRDSFIASISGRPTRGTFRRIVAEVCSEYGVTEAQMISKHPRKRTLCIPRAEIMLRANDAGYTLGYIGQQLGDRDHTTVLHNIRAAEKRRKEKQT